MEISNWLYCPFCKGKTRTQIRKETELKNFPLFCPKCKKETIVSVKDSKMTIITEPDA